MLLKNSAREQAKRHYEFVTRLRVYLITRIAATAAAVATGSALAPSRIMDQFAIRSPRELLQLRMSERARDGAREARDVAAPVVH